MEAELTCPVRVSFGSSTLNSLERLPPPPVGGLVPLARNIRECSAVAAGRVGMGDTGHSVPGLLLLGLCYRCWVVSRWCSKLIGRVAGSGVLGFGALVVGRRFGTVLVRPGSWCLPEAAVEGTGSLDPACSLRCM